MNKQVVLHIGTEKSGTTSLQEWLKLNIEGLAELGFCVPDFLRWPSQVRLVLAIADEDSVEDYWREEMCRSPEEISKLRVAFRNEIEQFVSQSTGETVIISSEHLSSRLTRDSELERLSQLFSGVSSEISIILYVRPPIEAAISSWSTQVRGGADCDSLPHPGAMEWLCDYRTLISRWERTFPGKINVRLGVREFLIAGDVRTDFAAQIGLDPVSLKFAESLNESLPGEVLLFWGSFNKAWHQMNTEPFPFPGELEAALKMTLTSNLRYQPSQEEIALYQSHYAASNAWLHENYFPDRTYLWDEL